MKRDLHLRTSRNGWCRFDHYRIILGLIFQPNKTCRRYATKTDLIALKKALEQYVSDHRAYPTVASLTYEYMNDTIVAGKLCGDKNR